MLHNAGPNMLPEKSKSFLDVNLILRHNFYAFKGKMGLWFPDIFSATPLRIQTTKLTLSDGFVV